MNLGLDIAAHGAGDHPRPPLTLTDNIPGSSVWAVRLPGSMTLGCVGSSENEAPRFWKCTPVAGSRTPDPNPAALDWIRLTALPAASTTAR